TMTEQPAPAKVRRMVLRAFPIATILSLILPLTAMPGCRSDTSRVGPSPDAAIQPLPAASTTPVTPVTPVVPPLSSTARIEDERNTITVFREVAPSTVFVTQKRLVLDRFWGTAVEVPAGSGSGFVWDKDGHIVTNFHVVDGARSLIVTLQGEKSFDAQIV